MAAVEFLVIASAQIIHESSRGKCATCDRRRELYRVAVVTGLRPVTLMAVAATSEARCATCWGMR